MSPVAGDRNKEETMKRNKRKKHMMLSFVLCILMAFTLLPTATFSAEYPYRYPAEKPYCEMSMYAYKVNAADAENYPTAIFRLLADDNRTLYAYCADSEIYDIPGTAYKAVPLSDHYGEAAETGKLRAIIQNAYPFISMDEMISRVEQSGISLHTASVPCYEMVLISAIQQALYSYTNPDIVIGVRFAGGVPQKVYETYRPLIYHYNGSYSDKNVVRAYPDIEADVEAIYSWLCALSPSNAPDILSVNASFAAEVKRVAGEYSLILYDIFDGFENYNERLNISVTEVVGTNENLIFEKSFNEFISVGEGCYVTDLPNDISGNSLKVTLSGYNDYEDAVVYEAEKAEPETSQPFIGNGKVRVNFSKTEQVDIPVQTGTLIIRKTVSGEGADATRDFTFSVKLMQNGSSLKGDITYGGVKFTNGIATFPLKHNEKKSISGIPSGLTYEVTEIDNGDYTVTKTNDTGQITAGTNSMVIFENCKLGGDVIPGPDPVGSVKIIKTVQGSKALTGNAAYEFRVWVRNSSNAVFESAAYKITATDGTTADSGRMTIGTDGYAFCLKNGESITFSDITGGRCVEVKEITAGDFLTETRGLTDGTCMISANTTKIIEFINDYGDGIIPRDRNDPDPAKPKEPAEKDKSAKPDNADRLDKPVDNAPKTGDISNIWLWIVIACLSLPGMAALTFGRKHFIARRSR